MSRPEMACAGRICLVTGAGRGLGRAYALALAAAGATVVVNDLGTSADGQGSDQAPAAEVVAEIISAGGAALADSTDIADWSAAEALVSRVVDHFGRLDVLVNNAGVFVAKQLWGLTEADVDISLRVNVKGPLALTRAAADYWRSTGGGDARLINITSTAGLYGVGTMGAYGASKAAVAALTQVAAAELAPFGVTANAVAPGAWTRMTAGLDLSYIAAERFGPEAVAPLIVWLASSDSADVTGQVFEANGTLLAALEGWTQGPSVTSMPRAAHDVGRVARDLLARARPRTVRTRD